MFHRIALAALLIGCLTASANAQKEKPKLTKPSDLLTWETVAADKAGKLITKRAQVPGGWLVVVQNGDDMTLTFLPDAGHRWSDDGSPSDAKPGKPQSDDLTKAAADKLKAEIEHARAAALNERDKAVATQKKLEEELKRVQDELEKTKKAKKPKKGDKADQASDANKAAERQRIAEALGLAPRDKSQEAKTIGEKARAAAVAEREKADAAQKQLAEIATNLEEALKDRKMAQADREEAKKARIAAEACFKGVELARQEALAQKAKAEAVAPQLQKQLAETTKALDEARVAEKRAAVQAASALEDNQRLKAELELSKKEAGRLRQLLDKKKK
jgi:hypothetical protein